MAKLQSRTAGKLQGHNSHLTSDPECCCECGCVYSVVGTVNGASSSELRLSYIEGFVDHANPTDSGAGYSANHTHPIVVGQYSHNETIQVTEYGMSQEDIDNWNNGFGYPTMTVKVVNGMCPHSIQVGGVTLAPGESTEIMFNCETPNTSTPYIAITCL